MDSPVELVIHGLEVTPEGGLVITYGRWPIDARKNGLMWTHSVHVPAGSDYEDELWAVTNALKELLRDVLEDEETAEHVEIPTQEEESEDE